MYGQLLSQLNERFDVASNATALLAQLLALEVAAPLSARSARFLCPPAVTNLTEDESLYVVPCLLTERGELPPPALVTTPATPHRCTIAFHPQSTPAAAAAIPAATVATTAIPTAAAAAAAAAVTAPIPSVLWSVLMCRCLLTAEMLADSTSAPPRLGASSIQLRLGRATVIELHRTDSQRVEVAIWSGDPTPIALFLGALAAHAARGARGGALDATLKFAIPRLSPSVVATLRPPTTGGAAASLDLCAMHASLRAHQPIIDPRTGRTFTRTELTPWAPPFEAMRQPDVQLICAAAADGPLAALMHLLLGRCTLAPSTTRSATESPTPHAPHARSRDTADGKTDAGAAPSAAVGATAEMRTLHVEFDHQRLMERATAPSELHEQYAAAATTTTTEEAAGAGLLLAASATPAAHSLAPSAIAIAESAAAAAADALPDLLAMADASTLIPIVSHAALRPLHALCPSHGRDWCHPTLLRWSLALALYESGRVAGLVPLLIGRSQPDGTIGRFELPRGPPRAPPGTAASIAPEASGHSSSSQLPDEVSEATRAVLHHLAGRLHLKLSREIWDRTVRGVVEAVVRLPDALQWAELHDHAYWRGAADAAATSPDSGDGGGTYGSGFDPSDDVGAKRVLQERPFQRACAHVLFAHGAPLGERRQHLGTSLRSRPFTEEFGRHERAIANLRGSSAEASHGGGTASNSASAPSLDVLASVETATARLEHCVRMAARRAVRRAHEQARGATRRGRAADAAGGGIDVDDLQRRLGDPPGVDELVGAARLNSAEHARALEQASRFCRTRGLASAEDLLGGGVDLQLDMVLWESFLAALQLSSLVFANRIRRELMQRRARLVDEAHGGRAKKGERRRPSRAATAAGGAAAACAVQ